MWQQKTLMYYCKMIRQTLPIEFIAIEPGNFHLFLKVKIARKNARLLLDTGASKTAFDSHQIEKFIAKSKLISNEIHSVGLGSNQMNTALCKLSSIHFGSIAIKKAEVTVLDLSHVNAAYQHLGFAGIDGVLGSDFLQLLQAEISYPKKHLKINNKSL